MKNVNGDGEAPFISVVIPTHNRRQDLVRVLDALFRQVYPLSWLEIIVVLDGCSDDTEMTLQSLESPCRLRYVVQSKAGQAVARNRGIQMARGEVIIFLDDDVEPSPNLVRAHAVLHARANNLVVQGYYPFSPQLKRNLHTATSARWWERHFNRLAERGHRLGHQDLSSGNFSVRREHLLAIGGFDEGFSGYGNEDYELGLRLAEIGLRFRFSREALAKHHHSTPLRKSLQRTRQEAEADINYGQKHPRLKRTFRFFTYAQDRSLGKVIFRIIAFRMPVQGDWLADRLLEIANRCEQFGLRGTWAGIVRALRRYHYWRGIRNSLGSYQALKEYLGAEWIKHPALYRTKVTTIDLREGIRAIEGLDGYRAAYILLKDGPKPLSWLWWASPTDWLSRRDIKEAIDKMAVGSVGNEAPAERRFADTEPRPSSIRRKSGPQTSPVIDLDKPTGERWGSKRKK
ncbi:MAG: glycosyltransferase family 2 protein [Chloroflexi bacterium]|nr:glycosyltransferase family 2 protein [Chloroflexota bacterium]